MSKKTGLAGAIEARKAINSPEPEPAPQSAAQAGTKAKSETKSRRFHTTLYPNPDLYRKIKIALLQEDEGRDFNQLVNELLRSWYDNINQDIS